jgi:hypothetical protein
MNYSVPRSVTFLCVQLFTLNKAFFTEFDCVGKLLSTHNARFLTCDIFGPDVQLVRRMLVLELKNQEVMVDEIPYFLD